jgi:hypothetical protein
MFDVPDYRSIGNFGGASMDASGEPTARREIVQCVRLDNIAAEGQVGLIKIDVEGHELEVLKGCDGIFARCHPLLYVENDRLEKSEALIQFLFDLDYRLWWHLPQLFNPRNYRGVPENCYPGTLSVNMVGIHRSLNVPIEGLTEILDSRDYPLARAEEPEK